MTVWSEEESLSGSIDFQIARDGFVNLFSNNGLLSESETWLAERGYQMIRFDAASWPPTLHVDVAREFHFPSYYGHNLDALADCLSDVAAANYGWRDPSDSVPTGLVIVFQNFSTVLGYDSKLASAVLNIFARAAAEAALFGNRMLVLVRVDESDAEVKLNPQPIVWNSREWPGHLSGQSHQ